jgi:3-hydroxybutyryl-CoA dehydrogenase
MVANLGCYMAEIALATPADIDLAMKLGLNYPLGPLELVEDMGAEETRRILSQLQAITGDDRYRPTPWLTRRARLGLPIHTPG